ncbi:HD family phosphohydrolase [Bacillus sp. HMF5848]|uniref:HD family phosphohydrolase n=1 Tax=Bacillus sp. HMF5848 TaxID=2495421 RepID=UPI0037C14244
MMFFLMYEDVKPERLLVKPFSKAEHTIYSPITVTDHDSTIEKRQAASQTVEDIFTLNQEYAASRVELVRSIFDALLDVKEKEMLEETLAEEGSEQQKLKDEAVSIQEQLTKLRTKLTDETYNELSGDVLTSFLKATESELEITKDVTITAVNNIMNERITVENVDIAKQKIERELSYSGIRDELKQASIVLGKFAIVQNVFFDAEETILQRQKAMDSVEPVRILEGQVIVSEGETIDHDILRQLELVGLVSEESTFRPYVGLALVLLLTLAPIIYYFYKSKEPANKKRSHVLLFGIVVGITFAMMKTISLFEQMNYSSIGYVVPVAMGALLIKILINEELAIWTVVLYAVAGNIMFNEGLNNSLNFSIGLYYLASGLAGVLFLNKQNRKTRILQTGLFIAIVNILVIIALMFLKNTSMSLFTLSYHLVMAIVSGTVSAVLTLGLLPFFEAGFKLLSPTTLLELSSPNHPLLRKILMETPGTYHHSVMVANLSEAACEAVGANGLLARVGAYYHDIGKTKRPQFFIENQLNIDNPHDKLSPQVSKNIIIAHATDGASMLRNHRMPKEIIDIAEQHHGTTLLKYFYHKATQSGDHDIQEDDFRYPGPKPQTKEAAIVCIADSVEAAIRSLSNPTPEKIEEIIRGIISDKLQDGQLNACDLTLKDLDIIAKTLIETINGMFHSRIQYPELVKKKVKEA